MKHCLECVLLIDLLGKELTPRVRGQGVMGQKLVLELGLFGLVFVNLESLGI